MKRLLSESFGEMKIYFFSPLILKCCISTAVAKFYFYIHTWSHALQPAAAVQIPSVRASCG
jgi:hypothetical protein